MVHKFPNLSSDIKIIILSTFILGILVRLG